MCDAENCAKVYCAPCIEKLCGLPELERVCIPHFDDTVCEMIELERKRVCVCVCVCEKEREREREREREGESV